MNERNDKTLLNKVVLWFGTPIIISISIFVFFSWRIQTWYGQYPLGFQFIETNSRNYNSDLSALWTGIISTIISFCALWFVVIAYYKQYEELIKGRRIEGYEQYIRDIIGGFACNERIYTTRDLYHEIKGYANKSLVNSEEMEKINESLKYWREEGWLDAKQQTNTEDILKKVISAVQTNTDYEKIKEVVVQSVNEMVEKHKVDELGEYCFKAEQLKQRMEFGYIDGLLFLLDHWNIFKDRFIRHCEHERDIKNYKSHFRTIARRMGDIQKYRQFNDVSLEIEREKSDEEIKMHYIFTYYDSYKKHRQDESVNSTERRNKHEEDEIRRYKSYQKEIKEIFLAEMTQRKG